jgi:hypothetical protein
VISDMSNIDISFLEALVSWLKIYTVVTLKMKAGL